MLVGLMNLDARTRAWMLLTLVPLALLGGCTPLTAGRVNRAASAPTDYNALVLRAVASMPVGGGYSVQPSAARALAEAMALREDGIEVRTQPIQSFCSGATYLVFLKTLALARENQAPWKREVLEALLVKGQDDGTGVWGRWNANGPGTARLFFELGLGRNFSDWSQAKPGDFMKIFWNPHIGGKESGHSVIYLGTKDVDGTTYVGIWSSNTSNPDGTSGMGVKWYPRSQIHRALFSRLENLEALEKVLELPVTDRYLADMLRRSSSVEEMHQKVGLTP
jgi:hypothetical protein